MPHRILTGEDEAKLERIASQIRIILYALAAGACIAVGTGLGVLVFVAAGMSR